MVLCPYQRIRELTLTSQQSFWYKVTFWLPAQKVPNAGFWTRTRFEAFLVAGQSDCSTMYWDPFGSHYVPFCAKGPSCN